MSKLPILFGAREEQCMSFGCGTNFITQPHDLRKTGVGATPGCGTS